MRPRNTYDPEKQASHQQKTYNKSERALRYEKEKENLKIKQKEQIERREQEIQSHRENMELIARILNQDTLE